MTSAGSGGINGPAAIPIIEANGLIEAMGPGPMPGIMPGIMLGIDMSGLLGGPAVGGREGAAELGIEGATEPRGGTMVRNGSEPCNWLGAIVMKLLGPLGLAPPGPDMKGCGPGLDANPCPRSGMVLKPPGASAAWPKGDGADHCGMLLGSTVGAEAP